MNVLVLDDEKLIGTLISDYLGEDPRFDKIHWSKDHLNSIKLIDELKISLAFLDLFMPNLAGLELIKDIRSYNQDIKIIVLSSHFDSNKIDKAIENGCNAFLNKNCSTEELKKSIDFVLQGKMFLSSDCKNSRYYENQDNREDPKLISDSLSERELEVLKHLSEGLNSTEIADKLFISKNTVDFHKKSLFRKFGTSKATKIVKIATKNNII